MSTIAAPVEQRAQRAQRGAAGSLSGRSAGSAAGPRPTSAPCSGAWLAIAVVLGFFAPKVETALSGAGWEASGSQSVQARKLVERDFTGLGSYGLTTVVYSPRETTSDAGFRAVVAKVERTLRADRAVSTVVAPAAGVSISRDGHTAIVQAGAARQPERDGRRRGQAEGQAPRALHGQRRRRADGRAGDVVGLQRRQPLGDAQIGGHLLAGHARHHAARVRLAGRGRAAADADDGRAAVGRGAALPRHADRADLDLGDELRADVRARARHRLRAVHRVPLPGGAVRLASSTRRRRRP